MTHIFWFILLKKEMWKISKWFRINKLSLHFLNSWYLLIAIKMQLPLNMEKVILILALFLSIPSTKLCHFFFSFLSWIALYPQFSLSLSPSSLVFSTAGKWNVDSVYSLTRMLHSLFFTVSIIEESEDTVYQSTVSPIDVSKAVEFVSTSLFQWKLLLHNYSSGSVQGLKIIIQSLFRLNLSGFDNKYQTGCSFSLFYSSGFQNVHQIM